MSQIQVSNLTFTYEGSYDAVFQDVSFQIDTDWKLGLIGRNGRGKTTLLRLRMWARCTSLFSFHKYGQPAANV